MFASQNENSMSPPYLFCLFSNFFINSMKGGSSRGRYIIPESVLTDKSCSVAVRTLRTYLLLFVITVLNGIILFDLSRHSFIYRKSRR